MPPPAVASAGRTAENAPVASLLARGLNLPVDQYVLVINTQALSSAIVVGDSGNLPKSGELPFEAYLRPELTSTNEVINATPHELVRAGLDGVFDPEPDCCIRAIPLPDAAATPACLIVKAPRSGVSECVKEICRNYLVQLGEHAAEARAIPMRYEWELLSHIFRCVSPCLAIEPARRVAAANNVFCEMLGRPADQLAGARLDDLVHFERQLACDVPYYPESVELTTPMFVKPLLLCFTSDVSLTRIQTTCGDRTIYAFQDIYTDRRTGNSNILLIQKISNLVLSQGVPQTVIRRMLNLLALTLNCDLVCVLRRKPNNEMIITPHCNRRPDTLQANVIEAMKEPVLEPFLTSGTPVFCESVDSACPESSFFRQVSPIKRFAMIPVGDAGATEYAVLAAWSGSNSAVGSEVVPLLRIIANLIGTVLANIRLITESEQEKETLRRYTRLTSGREVRMAAVKRENAQLKDLLSKLGSQGKDQCPL